MSLLICLASLALWPRSYWRNDTVVWSNAYSSDAIRWRHLEIGTGCGGLLIGLGDNALTLAQLDGGLWYANGFSRFCDEKPEYPQIDSTRMTRRVDLAGFAVGYAH